MKIQLASDLHVEFFPSYLRRQRLMPCAPEADVLVLPGDVSLGAEVVELFADWPVPVIFVAGNHEFYRGEMAKVRDELKRASAGTAVRFLDNETETIGYVRFLGSTLWTDYRLGEPELPQDMAMSAAAASLNDHRLIRVEGHAFRPQDALAEHLTARSWLEAELQRPHDGPTVVVTHHGPHRVSTHPRYARDALNPAFNSDLSPLLPRATLWVHGHVHDAFDYVAGGCRVVANPRGYPAGTTRTGETAFENAAFCPVCVLDV